MSATGTEVSGSMRLRVAATALVGSVVEWYDFFIFGTATALVFRELFFPTSSVVAGTLLAFMALGVGQLARPVGAVYFGNLGDRIGRKPVLIVTLVLMGLSTVAVGLLPTFSSIGILAPILLFVFRMAQGFAAGAELAGATVLSVEFASKNRRGLMGSIPVMGTWIGLALASGTFSLLTMLPKEDFLGWAWRIPFLASAVLLVFSLFIRSSVDESPAFKAAKKAGNIERVPVIGLLRNQWRQILLVFGLVAAITLGPYIYTIFIVSYATNQLGMQASTITGAAALASLLAAFTNPLFGHLSDRIGRRTVFMGGTVLSIIMAFPFFWMLEMRSPLIATFAIVFQAGIVISMMGGVQGSLFSELFNTENRYSGFALGRELSSAIFGGFGPVLAVSLLNYSGGQSWAIASMMVVVALISFVSTLIVPETSTANIQSPDQVAHQPLPATA